MEFGAISGLTWLLLLSLKIVNGIVVLGKACGHVKRYRELQEKTECEIFRKRVLMMKSKSAPNSPRISLIDFSGEFITLNFHNYDCRPFCRFCTLSGLSEEELFV